MAGATMHAPTTRSGAPAPRLDKSGIARIATIVAFLVLQATAFFAAAGSLAHPRGWLYFGGLALYTGGSMVVLATRFPGAMEIVNQRGKIAHDVKSWDRAIGVGYAVLVVVAPLVAGLDVRAGASEVSAWWFVPAMLATFAAMALAQWAIVANRFAETGVRVQRERAHAVVSSGPYRWVRHPMYVGIIVQYLCLPVCLGAPWAFAPGVLVALLFVVRTHLEDATLRAELPGYAEYARTTRFRLVPGIW